MSRIPFRRPDNPSRDFEPFLHKLDNGFEKGNWIAQPKGDGWRRPGYKEDGNWSFFAKATKGEEARSTPPLPLVRSLLELGLPDGIALDMEWMGMRCTEITKGRHWFIVYDMLYHNFEWQGGTELGTRLEKMAKVFARKKLPSNIIICPHTDEGFVDYFNAQRSEKYGGTADGLSEGVVCKRLSSKLLGQFPGGTGDCHNPDWRKVKYRDLHS